MLDQKQQHHHRLVSSIPVRWCDNESCHLVIVGPQSPRRDDGDDPAYGNGWQSNAPVVIAATDRHYLPWW